MSLTDWHGPSGGRATDPAGPPTPSAGRWGSISSVDWLVLIGATLALAGLGVVCLLASGCTINKVVLYETSNYPAVVVTPSQRIGPS